MWPWKHLRQRPFNSTSRNRRSLLALKRGSIETLEPRAMLSCSEVFARGELSISGDENPNEIRINIEGDRVRVRCDDSSDRNPGGGLYFNVHTINVDTHAHGDTITIVGRNFGNDPAVVPRITVDTGTGADRFSFTGDFRPLGLGPEGLSLQVDLGPRGDADSASVKLLGVHGGGPLDVAMEELTRAAEGLVLHPESDGNNSVLVNGIAHVPTSGSSRDGNDRQTSIVNQFFTGGGDDRLRVETKGYNKQTFGVDAGAGDDVVEYLDPTAQNATQLALVVTDPPEQSDGPILLGPGDDKFRVVMDLSPPDGFDLFVSGGIEGRVEGGAGGDDMRFELFGDSSRGGSTTYEDPIDLTFDGADRIAVDIADITLAGLTRLALDG